MTPYEMADLRATYVLRYVEHAKYWLTITFAVFAASFYVKAQADWRITLALAVFYIVNSILIFGSIKATGEHMAALVTDAKKFIAENPDAPAVVHAIHPVATGLLAILYAMLPVGLISLLLFLYAV